MFGGDEEETASENCPYLKYSEFEKYSILCKIANNEYPGVIGLSSPDGEYIKAIKQALIDKYFVEASKLEVNEDYDMNLKTVIQDFQNKYKSSYNISKVNGIIDKSTLLGIDKYCYDDYIRNRNISSFGYGTFHVDIKYTSSTKYTYDRKFVPQNPNIRNEYGANTEGFTYRTRVIDSENNVVGNPLEIRSQNNGYKGPFEIPLKREAVGGLIDYGIYYGSTNTVQVLPDGTIPIDDEGKLKGESSYFIPPIDAVDYGGYVHDMNYEELKIGEDGQKALFEDWGTTPADFNAIKQWEKVENLGVGAIDPYSQQIHGKMPEYKIQTITQHEYDAAKL